MIPKSNSCYHNNKFKIGGIQNYVKNTLSFSGDPKRIREYFPGISKDRLDFVLDMWGLDITDLGLAVNGYGTDYVQLRGEIYDLIEVLGQKALFTNQRLTKADIPQGLNVYHLR